MEPLTLAVMLTQATANAVLALYGIPEPPENFPIEKIIEALRKEAIHKRTDLIGSMEYKGLYWEGK